MSKLFKLKEWLTIPEAARHLTGVFGEEVTEADVLRLGLDGHVTLSVDFVNGTSAHLGKVVSKKDAEVKIFSRNIMDPMMREARELGYMTASDISEIHRPSPEEIRNEIDEFLATPEAQAQADSAVLVMRSTVDPNRPVLSEGLRKAIETGTLFWVVTDLSLDDENFIHLEDEISHIHGVWDLALIGSERLDIEHHYQQLTEGPEITGTNLNGTFVKRDDGTYASLQERFDSPEMRAIGKGLEKALDSAREKSGKPKVAPKARKPYGHPDNYFPAGKLPDDGVLVVRTSALMDFQSQFIGEPETAQQSGGTSQSTREKNTLLRIIGLMANQRYAGDVTQPYSIASHLTAKAQELGVKSPGEETIVKQIKAALALIASETKP